ncbi:MAG TPA: sugar phosphate isomerase/epimerase [Nitrososphaera sp.]|jgi:sugar phosphate isomerase/epimerase|nr:sugar phosphate isomerase/epimerase [Nitrososphaera sp.]HEX2615065.1 sugar phosphate isomerase/epimerase [Nitrososphaera sp.]
MIKLAFSTNAFKRHSLDDSVKEIAKIGYKGVEILCDVPHAYPPTFGDAQVELLKNTLASCNMQISNLNAFTLYAVGDVYHPSWIEDGREARIQHTIDCIMLAKKIDAANLSTEPGGPVPQNASTSQLEKIFLDGLAKAAKVAEQEDVQLLVEPEPFLLLENSRQFKSFIRNAGSDHIRLNFDIGHFYCVNEDPAKLVYELSDYIEHFHLADIAANRVHNHLIPGRGSIDFRPVFAAMDDIGYDGFVTVELYPYQDSPAQAAKEAYDYLCSIM